MEFIVAVIAGLVFCIIVLIARNAKLAYNLRKRHLESLFRIDDMVNQNLQPDTAEMLSAVVNEEMIGAVHG
jgi:hypothetical protein